MKVTKLSLPEVLKIEPRCFGDARGFFLESYNRHAFSQATGFDIEFVRTIIRGALAMCCVVCMTSSLQKRRVSW